MHIVRLDINDFVFDNVMFLLNNLPKNKVKLSDDIVSFFQKPPLAGTVKLKRNKEHI